MDFQYVKARLRLKGMSLINSFLLSLFLSFSRKATSFAKCILRMSLLGTRPTIIHKGHKFNSRYKPYKVIEYAQEGRVTVAVGTLTLKPATSCA